MARESLLTRLHESQYKDGELISQAEAVVRDATLKQTATDHIKRMYEKSGISCLAIVTDPHVYIHNRDWIVNVHVILGYSREGGRQTKTHIVAIDQKNKADISVDPTSPEDGQFALQEEGGLQRG